MMSDDDNNNSWKVRLVDVPDPSSSLSIPNARIVHAWSPWSSVWQPKHPNHNNISTTDHGANVVATPAGRIAVADYIARHMPSEIGFSLKKNASSFRLEMLGSCVPSSSGSRRSGTNRRNNKHNNMLHPFVWERTDVFLTPGPNQNSKNHPVETALFLHVYLRLVPTDEYIISNNDNADAVNNDAIQQEIQTVLQKLLVVTDDEQDAADAPTSAFLRSRLLQHVAIVLWQEAVRNTLPHHQAVAFVANGSILPRHSGHSPHRPMASPPAIPFAAPPSNDQNTSSSDEKNKLNCQTISIDMGEFWADILRPLLPGNTSDDDDKQKSDTAACDPGVISLKGLLVPEGITLIVGGGYHGKSTLLRCLSAGVANKIPGDGREFSATLQAAVTVRAEDGRYVNQCNVSAFIGNLPNSAGSGTVAFSTREASGSTSQAANVCEALEMGAQLLLVDEDTSAANFMARDGRMRALVQDESITPLLYRVNGLYATHKVSTIVVVGGVGDWLDVPHHVIWMDRYLCKDATAKAASVSRQFSHGHVQYGGRGVVHRLEWPVWGSPGSSITPQPRRPEWSKGSGTTSNSTWQALADVPAASMVVSLLDGVNSIVLHNGGGGHDDQDEIVSMDCENNDGSDNDDDGNEEDDEDLAVIDLSRCEQLLGQLPQLYGCALGVAWLLETSRKHPHLGLQELLLEWDATMDRHGMLVAAITGQCSLDGEDANAESWDAAVVDTPSWNCLVQTVGFARRPRRFELGQALTRLRGIQLPVLPGKEDLEAQRQQEVADRKKQELLDLWNARRKKKESSG